MIRRLVAGCLNLPLTGSVTMAIDAFEIPKKQVGRAKRCIDELDRGIGNYFAANPVKQTLRVDRARGVQVAIRHYSEFPDELSERVDDAITKLRSALDQAVYAASLQIDSSLKGYERAERGLAFPIADEPNKLDFKSVPAALHGLIRGFEPYPLTPGRSGGNHILWCLNRLANIHKHRFLVEAQVGKQSVLALSIGPVSEGPPAFAWNAEGRELSATLPLGSPTMVMAMINQCIAFAEPELVRNANIVLVLLDMYGVVDRIVGDIEAETLRILGEQSS